MPTTHTCVNSLSPAAHAHQMQSMRANFLSNSRAQMIENTFPVVQVKARFLNGLCFLDYTTRVTFVCQFDPPKMDSGLTGSSSDVILNHRTYLWEEVA